MSIRLASPFLTGIFNLLPGIRSLMIDHLRDVQGRTTPQVVRLENDKKEQHNDTKNE